jgi:hypothetical protein
MTMTQPQLLSVTNQLADVEGHVEAYNAKLTKSEVESRGNHAIAQIEGELPANLIQWRLRVTEGIQRRDVDAYLLHCPGNSNCIIVSHQLITNRGATLVVNKPLAGVWRVIIRSQRQEAGTNVYRLAEAQVVPTLTTNVDKDDEHRSNEKWVVAVPSAAKYAGFRIRSASGSGNEKDDLLIAVRPLRTDAP